MASETSPNDYSNEAQNTVEQKIEKEIRFACYSEQRRQINDASRLCPPLFISRHCIIYFVYPLTTYGPQGTQRSILVTTSGKKQKKEKTNIDVFFFFS